MRINLNIYDSNLHLVLLFSLGITALYMLFTFRTKEKPVPQYYKTYRKAFDYGSMRELGAIVLIVVLAIIIWAFG